LFSIPQDDPFWTAPEEPLPVEKDDYEIRFEAPRMIVTGTKSSGQVKWLQARNIPKRPAYRDKYTKLVCSSHFPFNTMKDTDAAPFDQAVVFRNELGTCATRLAVTEGKLTDDGIDTTWTTKLGQTDVSIRTEIRLYGEFEFRRHTVQAAGAMPDGWELLDGSYALPLEQDEPVREASANNWRKVYNRNGYTVIIWRLAGYRTDELATAFGPNKEPRVNIIHPRVVVLANTAKLRNGGAPLVFSSLHFASPKPPAREVIDAQAAALIQRWS
jgi:hypothetical protein